MEKWRTKPNANLSKYVDILYRAYKTDREAYEYIYDDLIENGADPKKIESQMETRMKKAEGVDKAPDLSKRYMSPDVEDKYDAKLKQIKKSDVWESANKDQKKNAEAALYDFLTSDSESMEKTREEAVALGIDETEYTLWQLAKEMAKDKGDGNEGFSKRERADAIQRLDLDSNTEWDLYLFNNEDDGASYARKQGVKSDTYANFIESLHKVDKPTKSGKYGSFTQEEAEAAIRKLKGLSQKEKAALWQSVNTKWKKNPFR